MSDLTVAEEFQEEKQKTRRQWHRKFANRSKHDLAKERIKPVTAAKTEINLRRIKRLSDLSEE